MIHPLFELFTLLKWMKIRSVFHSVLSIVLLYQVALFLFALQRFSILNDLISGKLSFVLMVTVYALYSTLNIGFLALNFVTCVNLMRFSISSFTTCLCFAVLRIVFFQVGNIVLTGLLLFKDLDDSTGRQICAVSLFTSGIQSLYLLSKKPSIGINVVMMSRVTLSVFRFFSAFAVLFLSFWAVFHILLPRSPTFGTLDNSFIKVLAMLMGEFDFTTNFIKDTETPSLAKVFFLIFILFMALVFMNLLLGLAVSDIAELERVSCIQTAMMTFHTIMMIEQMKKCWRWLPWFNSSPPIYRFNREIWLDIVDLDENIENRVYTEIGDDDSGLKLNSLGEGEEGCPETISYEVPHGFIERVLKIIQARVAKTRGYKRHHQVQAEYTGQAGQHEPSEYELEEEIGQTGIDEEIREIKSAIRNLTRVLLKEDINS